MTTVFFLLAIVIANTNAKVPFLFTSSWYGTAANVLSAKSATIDIKDCVRFQEYEQIQISTTSTILSPISEMNNVRNILSTNPVYIFGEDNKFFDFVSTLNYSTIIRFNPMYPNDVEIMTVVLEVFKVLSGPSTLKSDLMIIINRTKDYNNLAINNFDNIIQILNKQGWVNINVLEFKSVDNIMYNLYQQKFFTIISLLQDPLVNSELYQKAFFSHFFIWRYRWIILDLLGGTNVLNQTLFRQGVVSNNVTIITFAQNGIDGRGVLLRSAFNLTIAVNCTPTETTLSTESGQWTITKGSPKVRNTYKFGIYQNPGAKMEKIGDIEYTIATKAVFLPPKLVYQNFELNVAKSIENIKLTGFTIGFIDYPPYSMRIGTNYTGFAIELLFDVLNELGVPVTIIPIPEQQIGSFNSFTRRFNGMLGIVQNGTIDTVSVPIILTINELAAFDFSTNVLLGYIAALYSSPMNLGTATLNNYAQSFHYLVWIAVISSAVAIALALAFTDFFYPDKFARYKLLMSTFFSISSITQGAYFDPPRRVAGRIIMSFWWLFCLFVVVIWATNYAAFLAQQNTEEKLISFFSILKQSTRKIITINDHLVFSYLINNPYQDPRTLYRIMNEETTNGTVNSVSEAIALVKTNQYIFLYDDKTISYHSYQDCLIKFGKFVSFDYGFALPKHSEKTLAINELLAKRFVNGFTSALVRKYWPNHNPNCTSSDILGRISSALRPLIQNPFTGSLTIHSMIGVFAIPVVGGIGLLFLAAVEKIIRAIIKKSQQNKDRFRYENTVEQLTTF